MALRRATGNAFEAAAEAHAAAHGVQTLARNFNSRFGEIDLVLKDRDVIVFAEVRYRDSARFGGAIASVDLRKQKRMATAAALYLQAHPALARAPCRFDVFAIAGEAEAPTITWIRDAFRIES